MPRISRVIEDRHSGLLPDHRRRPIALTLAVCLLLVLIPNVPWSPATTPHAQAHGEHPGPPDDDGLFAYCFVNSMRQANVPAENPAPSIWISCQYGPTDLAIASLHIDVTSSDKQTLAGDWGYSANFGWDDCQLPGTLRQCVINESGLFQMAIVQTGPEAPTTSWTDLRVSGCVLNHVGSIANHGCSVGLWSKAQTGYPPFPVHWWAGGVDGNKVPIGQTYGDGSDEDADNPSALWGDPVNSLTGSFYSSMVDVQMPGIGRPFQLKRTYNSGAASIVGPFGGGWRFTYGAYLNVLAGGDVMYHTSTGKQLAYAVKNDGLTFQAGPGVTASLVKNGNGTYSLTRQNGTVLNFLANGDLSSLADRNNNATTLAYTSGDLSSITDTAGRVVTITTNAAGKITKVTLPDGRFVSYSYASNNLLSVTDLLGNTWSYTYDGSHRLLTITDPRPKTTITNVYSGGRVVQQTDGEGKVSTFGWDAATNTATFIDERGFTWKHVYANNKLIEVIPPAPFSADTTKYTYDGSLKPATIREPDGDIWRFDYVHDASGALTQLTATDPMNRTTVTTYTGLHQPNTITDPRGKVTDYDYDAKGNLTQITQPANVVMLFAYNPTTGKLTSVTDPNGKTTTFGYGAKGNLTKVTDPLGKFSTFVYDSTGRLTQKTDPRLKVWTYGYNNANQLTSVDPPLVPATTYTYSKVGQLKTVTDGRGNVTTYNYDGNGRLINIKGPDATVVTTYTYLPTGELDTAKDANNHVWNYDVDEVGRVTSLTDPLSRAWLFDYLPDGALETKTLPSGDTITYEYWADGQTKSVLYSNPSTPDVSFAYDMGGRVASMTDGAGTVTYGYDDLDRLTSVARGPDQFTYTYLPGGQLDVVTYPGGSAIDYDYRDDSRVDDVTADGAATTYGYDDAGNLTTANFPNGITTTYTWDDAGRLKNVEHRQGTSALQNYAITLDANGNPTRVIGPSGTTNYAYDMFDRVTSACTPSCVNNPTGLAYTYDKVGNRLTETRYGAGGGTTTYVYDVANQLTSTSGLTPMSYGYDANGNQTSAGARTFSFDSEGRLLSTADGPSTQAYTYDGTGKMLTRSIGGVTDASFLWDINAPMAQLAIERDGSGGILRRYTYGPGGAGGLLSLRTGGASHFYLSDALGSVGALSSPGGTLEWSYAYEPYGRATPTQLDPGAPANPMSFHGQYQEPVTSLYNMRARQYDARTGRFLGIDSLRATAQGRIVSSYTYSFNQPTTLTDPSGLAPGTADFFSSWLCGGPCSDTFGQTWGELYASWKQGPLWAKITGGALIVIGTAGIACSQIQACAAYVESLAPQLSSSASNVSSSVDPNKLNHIFGKAQHNLSALEAAFGGSRQAAYEALQRATQAAVNSQRLTGVFEVVVRVGGSDVTVRGKVVDGVARIGTAYR
jgi:RHS repeat-associated protein